MIINGIEVIEPGDNRINSSNYLIKKAVDFFNACMLDSDFEIVRGEKVVEIFGKDFCNKVILDEAIKLLNQAGWNARHGGYYSLRGAFPSHAIYVKC